MKTEVEVDGQCECGLEGACCVCTFKIASQLHVLALPKE